MARILIIEDNQDIHALIKQSLGQDHELVSTQRDRKSVV